MHECVYTNQKIKKIKKWMDGFVDLNNRKVTLYTEDKKILTTDIVLVHEDDMLETRQYLIQSTNLATAPSIVAEPPITKILKPQESRVQPRTKEEIMQLFKCFK